MSKPTRRAQVVKVNDALSMVEAIPHFLGFEPAESLVAVALVHPRERMQFAIRLDLVTDDGYADAAARMVRERMRGAGAIAVVLAVFSAADPVGDLPHRALVDAVEAALGVPVREAVYVTPGRFWSYLCSDPRCCPVGGIARDRSAPGPVALAAAHALLGRTVLPSRDAVLATVERVGGDRGRAMDAAIHRALDDRSTDPRRFRVRAVRLVEDLAARYADPRAELTDDEAATVAVALHGVRFRDELIVRCIDDPDDSMRRLAGDVARLAQPPWDPPACAVLACAAYFAGDGLTVSAAAERALGTDPDYSLARLLVGLLDRAVSPEELRNGWRDALPPRRSRRRAR